MIIFFESFLIVVFAFFAIALGYQAIVFLKGLFVPLAIIIMIAEAVASIRFFSSKVKNKTADERKEIMGKSILSICSSALCMFISFLCLHDLCTGYDNGFGGVISMLFALAYFGLFGLLTIGGWIQINTEDEIISGIIKELIGAAGIIFIFLI